MTNLGHYGILGRGSEGTDMQEFAHDYLGAIGAIAAIIGAVASLVSAVAWVAVLVMIIIIVRDAMKARGD